MLTKTQPSKLIILLAALVGLPQLGCISGGLKKPNLPSLPSLAFWKKDGASELPPPPARHFDPTRFDVDSTAETQVVDSGQSRESFDEYGLKKGTLAAVSQDKKPIRKPYSLQDLASRDAEPKTSFGIDADRVKDKFEQAKSSAESKLSSAQQDFQFAMSSTVPATQSYSGDNSFGGGSFEPTRANATGTPSSKPFELKSPAGNFDVKDVGVKNALASIDNIGASAKNRIADASSQFGAGRNQFAGALSGARDSIAKNSIVNNGLSKNDLSAAADINTNLYDANGRLRSAAKDLVRKTNDAIQSPNALKTKFEQRLAAAQKRAAELGDGAKNQLNSLATNSERTRQAIAQPFPKFNGTLPASGSSTKQAGSAFEISKTASTDATSKMQQEVQEARRQIELLKKQVAQAKLAAAKKQTQISSQVTEQAPKQNGNQFAVRSSQQAGNTVEGVVLPIQTAVTQFQGDTTSSVASQSSNGFSPSGNGFAAPASLRPKASSNVSPPQPSSPANNSESYYPSTPYGGFGVNRQPSKSNGFAGNSIGQVGFQANANKTNSVAQANALMPLKNSTADRSEEIYQASRIDNSVSGVSIPEAILTGNSSFAPGSVNPLRK